MLGRANCTRRRLTNLGDGQRNIWHSMFVSMVFKTDNYQEEEEEDDMV